MNFEAKFKSYIRLKWLVLALAALVAVIEGFLGLRSPLSLQLYFTTLAVLAAANFLAHRLAVKKAAAFSAAKIIFFIDLFGLSAILYLGGGSENPFCPILVLLIFIVSFMFYLRFALFFTALAFAAVGLFFWLETARLIPHIQGPYPHEEFFSNGPYVLHYLMSLFALYFAAALISSFFNRELDKYNQKVSLTLAELTASKIGLENDVAVRTHDLELARDRLSLSNRALLHVLKDLKTNLEKLKELDEMKSNLISSVSHELRTPISIVREGLSQMLEGFYGKIEPEQNRMLNIAVDNIDRLARLISNLLDVAKIEAGKVELKKAPVDLIGIAKETADSFRAKARAQGIEIIENYPPDGLKVVADRDRLCEIFMNLIENAVKFTDKGRIVVSVEDKNDSVECSVADTGKGIAAKDQARVFTRFEQFHRESGQGSKGIGLGLAIVKELVELHGGQIRVESEFGQGAKFIFTIPKGGING